MFRSKRQLTKHIRIHRDEKPFECDLCDFMCRTGFKIGIRREYFWKNFIFKPCIRTSRALKLHQAVHTDEKPFECEDCGKKFKSKQYLNRHRLIHTHEKSFKCEDCGKCFLTKNQLKTHRRIHTGERAFKCEECGKEFTTKHILKQHSLIHTGLPFECELCGKKFRPGFEKTVTQIYHKILQTGWAISNPAIESVGF